MAELFGRSWTRAELEQRTGRLEQLGGILPLRYAEGRADGVRAFLLRTGGGLSVECVADRALDIASASLGAIPLAWQGSAGVAAPAFCAPGTFEQNFFGGLVTTCGLTAFGPPGEDRWGSWDQHGRVNHLPAEQVAHRTYWEDDRCLFEISGTVHETQLFGEHLVLERRWRAELGSNVLHLVDRVTNRGGTSTPHMLLYHCNAGFPLLDDESAIYVSQTKVTPRDEPARKALAKWNRGGPPQAKFSEEVFIHECAPIENGWAAAMVHNARLGVALVVRYRVAELPALFTWRMLGYQNYVMAMEPANCATIAGRFAAENNGTLPFLEPGESREYALTFEALNDASKIEALRRQIGKP